MFLFLKDESPLCIGSVLYSGVTLVFGTSQNSKAESLSSPHLHSPKVLTNSGMEHLIPPKYTFTKKWKTLLQLVPNQHRLLRHLLLFTFTHSIQKRCINPPLQREISPRATERDYHLQRTTPCTRFRLVGGGGCSEVSCCIWERCACVSYWS